jgi:hypothetical protein
MLKRKNSKRNGRQRFLIATALLAVTFYVVRFPSPAHATPSQEEVFKSIQQNVGGQSDDGGRGLAMLLGGIGGVIAVILLGARVRAWTSRPRVMDHPRKLVREVLKNVPLKPKELKQLKMLVEASRQEGSATEPIQSPLTLVLCPSVLARAMKNRPAKIDRVVIGQLVRKMSVAQPPAFQR